MIAAMAAALASLERGWVPVPTSWILASGSCSCRAHRACGNPGKHPRVPWRDRDTVTDGEVRHWWKWWPRAGVAILTGPSRLVVIDVDPRHDGTTSLHELQERHGPLPATLTARTGGGGEHRYLTAPDGVEIRNDQSGRLGAGVDVRAAGGLIVAPPTIHASGRAYTWIDERQPVAACPPWLVDLLRPPTIEPRPAADARAVAPGYAGAALHGECGAVASCASGGRNAQLNRSAFSLGQLVGAGALDEDVVAEQLLGVALQVGLGEHEARTTIRSGLHAGRQRPRPITA